MIDAKDRKILQLLQDNCRQSIADIGEKAGLSASACHRRIALLEERGYIDRHASQLNGDKLGFKMTFFVEVTLESQSEAVLRAFEKAALASPGVLECYLMTGAADYLVKVAARDVEDYESLYKRTIASLPHVVRIQSALVMKTVKGWSGYPLGLR